MHPLRVLVLCLLTLWAVGACDTAGEAAGPSFLILVADDLGRSFVGAYGAQDARTPSIDRLAAEGLRFDAAFTPTALCRPSRWAIYTGLYPHASGVMGFNRVPQDVSLLHEVLGEAGYRTGLVGKFGSRVQEFKPFDFFVGNQETGDGKDVEAVRDAAERFLEESRREPFFLVVGFGDPHVPYPEPDRGPTSEVPPYLPDLPEVRDELARYRAAIARLDRGVGAVLDALRDAGREADTMVLFVSDHGPAFPFAKSSLYDAGVHVPVIARWPGRIAAGGATSAPLSFVDIRPTILRAAGVSDPTSPHGTPRSSLLGAGGPVRDTVFLSHTANFEGTYPMRGIRTEGFKYIRNFEPGTEFVARLEGQEMWSAIVRAAGTDPDLAERLERYAHRPAEELYDLRADPGERRNLAERPDHADVLAGLRERLRQVMVETGDPLVEKW